MAGFKTHITTSTVLGVGYAAAGYVILKDEFSPQALIPSCMLAGGLCSVSGMLPDLDSDSGVPVRETMSFAAAVVPMLMMDRFQHLGWSSEMMVFAGGLIYVGIRFGVAAIFKKYTVHRGMWHSIPAAAVVGLLAFLVCSCDDLALRGYKTGAVVLGFMSHLVLDEFWSLKVQRGRLRVKKSFGTALKFWGRSRWGNFSVYAKLVILIFVVAVGEPALMKEFGGHKDTLHRIARQAEQLGLTTWDGGEVEGETVEGETVEAEQAVDGNVEDDATGFASPLERLVPTPIRR